MATSYYFHGYSPDVPLAADYPDSGVLIERWEDHIVTGRDLIGYDHAGNNNHCISVDAVDENDDGIVVAKVSVDFEYLNGTYTTIPTNAELDALLAAWKLTH